MAKPNDPNRAIPPIIDDDDDEDDGDITDVWDEERLKAALGELRKDEASGPATKATGDHEASIQVADDRPASSSSSDAKADTDPPPARGASKGGLSWPLTVALAVAVFAAVYLLVTLFRG